MKDKIEEMVLGFALSKDREYVALIEKQRPDWQKGRLNGIGGHIEKYEGAIDAMAREFFEETGFRIPAPFWKFFATMYSKQWKVHCFACEYDLSNLKSKTDEQVMIIRVKDIGSNNYCIENVNWLVLMAIDSLIDGRPSYAEIKYE